VTGPVPLPALLHGSGLDDLAMIVVGLALAYGVIAFTGRRDKDEETDEPVELPVDEQAERPS
jgi:hypothetical protein